MTDVFYVDGALTVGETAHLPVTDLMIMRGYGVFDFTRTYHRQPFHLREHIERLFASAHAIELDMPFTVEEIIAKVHEALALSTHPDCFIRILVTGGDGLDSITPSGQSRLTIVVTKAQDYALSDYQNGLKVITTTQSRYLAGVKTLGYISAVRAMKEAKQADAVEAIYVDSAGYVYEGTTTNIFIVSDGKIITPPLKNVLDGITRRIVFELSQPFFEVIEAPFKIDQLYGADEVFITSSTKEVMPITRVDDLLVGDGKVGAVSQKLITLFKALAQNS
jgi:branched-chain amino acid aminotransferase